MYEPPAHWVIEEGSVLTELVDENKTISCSHGINFGTLDYVLEKHSDAKSFWVGLVRVENVIVPYTTDGKARASELQLLYRFQ
jgi:hypothetical protein